jgi:hypothetical protein
MYKVNSMLNFLDMNGWTLCGETAVILKLRKVIHGNTSYYSHWTKCDIQTEKNIVWLFLTSVPVIKL